jgi:hypothetical protein
MDGCDECVLGCTEDAECADGNACNGAETCDESAGTCIDGTAVDCDDGDACTADMCVPDGSCIHLLIDADGDGFAASSLGTCGTDCDDTDNTIYVGAPEACDTIDQDCDGEPMPSSTPSWYADCDSDTYPAAGAASMVACAMPTSVPCAGGTRTLRPPTGSTIDCNDSNDAVRPNAEDIRSDGIDNNCDGLEACYTDRDNDGYRADMTIASTDLDCTDANEGAASDPAGDCNDGAGFVHPDALELCNRIDEDCDGSTVNTCPSTTITYGTPSMVGTAGVAPGGTVQDAVCMPGWAVSGFVVGVGTAISRLGPLCHQYEWRETTGLLNNSYTIAATGGEMNASAALGGGAPTFTERCPSDMVVTGVSGFAGTAINQFAFVCHNFDVVRESADSSTFVVVRSDNANQPMHGVAAGGTPYSLECPTGSVMVSMHGWATGSTVNAFAIRCSSLGVVPR